MSSATMSKMFGRSSGPVSAAGVSVMDSSVVQAVALRPIATAATMVLIDLIFWLFLMRHRI